MNSRLKLMLVILVLLLALLYVVPFFGGIGTVELLIGVGLLVVWAIVTITWAFRT